MEKTSRFKQLLTIGLAIVLVVSNLFVSMPMEVFAEETSNEESSDEESSKEESQYSVNETIKDGSYEVSVKADKGVYPDGAKISVKRITKNSDIENAINEKNEDAEVIVAFDIKVVDEDGNELQPDNKAGSIYVSIKSTQIDEDKDYEVYHVDEQKMEAEAMGAEVNDDVVEFETTHFSVYVLTKDNNYGGVTPSPSDIKDLVGKNSTQIELRKGSDSGTKLDSSTPVSLSNGDELYVKYLFLDPLALGKSDGTPYADLGATGFENTPILIEGKSYDLPGVPAWFDYSTLKEKTIEIKPAGASKKFGDVIFNADGSVVFKAINDFSELTYCNDFINGAYAGFHAKFIATETGNTTDEEQDIKWSAEGPTFKINNTEYKKQPPSITKSVIDKGNGKLKWTITLTQKANPEEYTTPYFEDTYSTDGQLLDETSFEVKVGATTLTKGAGYTLNADTPGKFKLTLNNPLVANDVVTIEYETTITDAEKIKGTSFTNKVEYKKDDGTKICDDNASYSFPSSATWAAKTGIKTDLTTGEMIWKVEIHTNGFNFKTLTLCDQMIKGSYKDESDTSHDVGLEFAGFVDETDGHADVADDYYYGTKDSGGVNPDYDWSYQWSETDFSDSKWKDGANGDKVMTLYYKTKISGDAAGLAEFKKLIESNTDKLPQNSAFLMYTFPGGVTPGQRVGEPSLAKPNGLTGVQIKKEAIDFDYKTREFTWKITVNENGVNLNNVHVIETIGNDQKKDFIDIQEFGIDNSDSPAATTYNNTKANEGVYDIYLGNIDAKTEITVKTKMTEEEFKLICTKNGTSKDYENYAKLLGPNLEVKAKRNVKGEVFKKSNSGYDYDKHVITWKLEVNPKKIDMGDVCITDNLATNKMSLYEDDSDAVSVSIDDGEYTNIPKDIADPNGRYYTYANGELKVYLGALGKKKANAKVKAKVDDSVYNTEAISIPNEAKLDYKYGGSPFDQSDNDTLNFTNNIISKEKVSMSGTTINYRINLNTAKMDVGGMVITDTLGSGLIYNEASITLKKATVNSSNGKLTATGSPISISKNISTDGSGNQVLKFTLPTGADGKCPFILEYSVLVIDPTLTTVTNKASINGYASVGDKDADFTVDAGTFSGAGLTSIYKLVIDKKDIAGNPLPGAKFKVTMGADSSEYTTGTNGQCTVYYFSKPTSDITVTEIEPPTGYILGDSSTATIGVSEWTSATDKKITKKFINKKKPSVPPAPKPNDPDDNDNGGGSGGGGSTPPPVTPTPLVPTPLIPPTPIDALPPDEYPTEDPIVVLGVDPNSGYPIVYTEELPDGYDVEEYNDEYDIIRQIKTGKVLGVIRKGVLGARNKRSPKTGELPIVPMAVGIVTIIGFTIFTLERKRKKENEE